MKKIVKFEITANLLSVILSTKHGSNLLVIFAASKLVNESKMLPNRLSIPVVREKLCEVSVIFCHEAVLNEHRVRVVCNEAAVGSNGAFGHRALR